MSSKANAPNSPTVCSSYGLRRRQRLEHRHLAEVDELIQRGWLDGPAPFQRRSDIVRAGYPPMPWQMAQRARAADLNQVLDDVERRLARLPHKPPSGVSDAKKQRLTQN